MVEVVVEAGLYFQQGLSFSTRGLDRQKDSMSAGLFFLAGVKRSVLFSPLPFFVPTAWQERRERSFANKDKKQNKK